jgi:integrase
MKRVFSPALIKANVRQITFHELRNTGISQAVASDAVLLVINRIAGHANPSITLNVYIVNAKTRVERVGLEPRTTKLKVHCSTD